MGPLGVVVLTEVFDHDPGLGEGPELLAVEAFIAEAGVERFDEAVARILARQFVQPYDQPGALTRRRSHPIMET